MQSKVTFLMGTGEGGMPGEDELLRIPVGESPADILHSKLEDHRSQLNFLTFG